MTVTRTFLALCCSALLAGPTFGQTWSFVVDESELLTATGRADMDAAEMATNGTGLFAIVDVDDTVSENILLLDPSQALGSQATLIATAADIKASVDAANGSSADYVAADLAIQGLGFNTAGKLIAYVDDGTNAASLISIEPVTPFTINVLSTSVDGAASPVEGGSGILMDGNTAYLLVERDFGAAEDAVLAVDTSTIVNDGSLSATTVIGETDLLAATGETDADLRLNCGTTLSATELLVINSGRASSNDDILKITLGSPNTVAPFVLATEIEAETGDADVGMNAIAVAPNGDIFLGNAFGANNVGMDDGLIVITGVASPSDITVLTAYTEAAISGDVGGSNLFLGGSNIVYDASTGQVVIFSGGTGTEGLIGAPALTLSTVQEWISY